MVVNLPTTNSVGEDIPALFLAQILTMRLQSSTFWGSVTRIVVYGLCAVVRTTPLVDITVTQKEFGLLTVHESVTYRNEHQQQC